jgi:MipA family protein
MNYLHNKISTYLLTAIFTTCAAHSFAEETQPEDKPQQTDINSRDGYYLSIGAGLGSYESPLREEQNGLVLAINGRYQLKGFFAELGVGSSGSFGPPNLPTLGYNFYGTEHWNLDVLYAITQGTGELSYEVDGEAKQISRLPVSGVGFRALGSWGNTTLHVVGLHSFNSEFRPDADVSYAALWLGHRWQIKNWSLNGLVGAKYRSNSLMNYGFGVTESEADKVVGAYEPSSGVDYTAQIDLTYPISKNVLFQIYSSYTQYSDEILHSPIIKLVRKSDNRPEKEQVFGVLVHYVF